MAKNSTNAEFARSKDFVELCERENIKPTKRQASKFRMKKGLAYKAFRRQETYVAELK